jgi:hypothetical protein
MKLKSLALSLGFAVLASMSLAAQTSYNFRTINYPHDTFTQILGVSDQGEAVGYHNVNDNKGFTYQLANEEVHQSEFPRFRCDPSHLRQFAERDLWFLCRRRGRHSWFPGR